MLIIGNSWLVIGFIGLDSIHGGLIGNPWSVIGVLPILIPSQACLVYILQGVPKKMIHSEMRL